MVDGANGMRFYVNDAFNLQDPVGTQGRWGVKMG